MTTSRITESEIRQAVRRLLESDEEYNYKKAEQSPHFLAVVKILMPFIRRASLGDIDLEAREYHKKVIGTLLASEILAHPEYWERDFQIHEEIMLDRTRLIEVIGTHVEEAVSNIGATLEIAESYGIVDSMSDPDAFTKIALDRIYYMLHMTAFATE